MARVNLEKLAQRRLTSNRHLTAQEKVHNNSSAEPSHGIGTGFSELLPQFKGIQELYIILLEEVTLAGVARRLPSSVTELCFCLWASQIEAEDVFGDIEELQSMLVLRQLHVEVSPEQWA